MVVNFCGQCRQALCRQSLTGNQTPVEIMIDPDSGKPDDKMIIGDGAMRVLMSHSGDGRIAMFYTSGEGGWFDANEVAAVLGDFISRNL